MKQLSKEALIGYPAGIITGITYGLNPLFGVPLMKNGMPVVSFLFFRNAITIKKIKINLIFKRQKLKM